MTGLGWSLVYDRMLLLEVEEDFAVASLLGGPVAFGFLFDAEEEDGEVGSERDFGVYLTCAVRIMLPPTFSCFENHVLCGPRHCRL